MHRLRRFVCALIILCASALHAEVLDPDSPAQPTLAQLSGALDALHIDVAFNLNLNELARALPLRPRVGILADIPALSMPLSPELRLWEDAFLASEIGAIAFLSASNSGSGPYDDFYDAWLAAPLEERYMLTYAAADQDTAVAIAQALAGQFKVYHVTPQSHGSEALSRSISAQESGGRLFVTVGQRWVVDSTAARDFRSELPEFLYLGESLRRNSDSVLNPESRQERRLASAEPAVFLKESLGDEFEASTIPEIIVPGGIALGEEAVFRSGTALAFTQETLWIVESGEESRALPSEATEIWKAAFDFAARSNAIASDAIVDIDERGRVKISTALEDTDLGFNMVRIDTEPFNYVTRLDVRKSVIVDSDVEFLPTSRGMDFKSEYEVRFLQSDRMRIARTQAAIVYRYQSETDSTMHIDSWGPDAFKLEGRTDFDGLGESTADVARYAAWIALFRAVHDQELDFSRGRYEFLKLDKAGRATPSRL